MPIDLCPRNAAADVPRPFPQYPPFSPAASHRITRHSPGLQLPAVMINFLCYGPTGAV
jgi:hypothetical protein